MYSNVRITPGLSVHEHTKDDNRALLPSQLIVLIARVAFPQCHQLLRDRVRVNVMPFHVAGTFTRERIDGRRGCRMTFLAGTNRIIIAGASFTLVAAVMMADAIVVIAMAAATFHVTFHRSVVFGTGCGGNATPKEAMVVPFVISMRDASPRREPPGKVPFVMVDIGWFLQTP